MDKLRIYKQALKLIREVYKLIQTNEALRKDFSLNDQLKRASISIILNIVEGNARGIKQFKNYLNIACGSCNEVVAALEIIEAVHDISTSKLKEEYLILARQITAFSRSFK